MDPQIKSVLTSFALTGATFVATWAVGHGFVAAQDQTALVDILVSVSGGVAWAFFVWFKARGQSPTALIQAVNAADNGVKVVDAKASAPAVNEPKK